MFSLLQLCLCLSPLPLLLPPVAWADEKQVNCPQKFRDGSDFDGDVNAKVGKYLQRDCEFPADQISRLSIRDEGFGETTGAGTGDDQQSEPLLKVNDVKVGDKEVTGSVFWLPGQQARVQVFSRTDERQLKTYNLINRLPKATILLRVNLSPLQSAFLQDLSYVSAMK